MYCYILLENTHTHAHTHHMCCPSTHGSCHINSGPLWKHTCEFTKTQLQSSLNSSICPSPLSFISFAASRAFAHTHTHERRVHVVMCTRCVRQQDVKQINRYDGEQRRRSRKSLLLASYPPQCLLWTGSHYV